MGRLAEVIKFEYGFEFQPEFTPKPITLVAATITEILKENPDRVRWTVVNLGTDVVYLSHDPAPSATNGYYLDKMAVRFQCRGMKMASLPGTQFTLFRRGLRHYLYRQLEQIRRIIII